MVVNYFLAGETGQQDRRSGSQQKRGIGRREKYAEHRSARSSKQEQQIESGCHDGSNVFDRSKTAERSRQTRIDGQKLDFQAGPILKFRQQVVGPESNARQR